MAGGIVAYITIIGIPWRRACFVMGQFSFFPFGKEAISRRELRQASDIGTGALGTSGTLSDSSLPDTGWPWGMSQPAPDFLYFAYGSNMSSRRLTAPGRAPSATRVTVAYVPGRRLTFDKFSTRDRSRKCDCEATGNPRDRVYGVVYRIAASERAAIARIGGQNGRAMDCHDRP